MLKYCIRETGINCTLGGYTKIASCVVISTFSYPNIQVRFVFLRSDPLRKGKNTPPPPFSNYLKESLENGGRYVDIKCLFNFFAEMNFLFCEDYDVQTAYKFQLQNPGNITYPPPLYTRPMGVHRYSRCSRSQIMA